MKLDFSVEQTIKDRASISTYEEREISETHKEKLMSYANSLVNPFGVPVSFQLLETKDESKGSKFGTLVSLKEQKHLLVLPYQIVNLHWKLWGMVLNN